MAKTKKTNERPEPETGPSGSDNISKLTKNKNPASAEPGNQAENGVSDQDSSSRDTPQELVRPKGMDA